MMAAQKTPHSPAAGDVLDKDLLRRAMGRFATGVTVVTTCGPNGKLEGVTANSFATVSLDPPLVLWSLGRSSASFQAFHDASYFAINVLGVGQMGISRHFATRQLDKFKDVEHHRGAGQAPILAGTIAHFECATEKVIEGGDHAIFVGRVLNTSFRDGEPLVFSKGGYHRAIALVEDVTS